MCEKKTFCHRGFANDSKTKESRLVRYAVRNCEIAMNGSIARVLISSVLNYCSSLFRNFLIPKVETLNIIKIQLVAYGRGSITITMLKFT